MTNFVMSSITELEVRHREISVHKKLYVKIWKREKYGDRDLFCESKRMYGLEFIVC